MRILHVTNTYLPVRNGVTVSVAGWVDGLRAAGHEVAVWTVGSPDDRLENVYWGAGAGQLADGFPIPLSTSPPREVATAEWDIVHVHHPVLLGSSALRFARRRGIPAAATAHSDYVSYVSQYVPRIAPLVAPLALRRMRQVFNATDVVFTPSAGVAESLRSWGVSAPLVPASYPVDIAALDPRTREEARALLGIDSRRPVALYAGRLAPEKRPMLLVDEFRRTLESVRDAVLVVAGDGPLLEKMQQCARDLGSRIVFTGQLDSHALGLWYCAADVFVSASATEVGPLACIEAGLCRTATVAYRVPGFADRVMDGRSGLLAECGEGALAAAIVSMLSDRQAASAMGASAAAELAAHTVTGSVEGLVRGYALASARAAELTRSPRSLEPDVD